QLVDRADRLLDLARQPFDAGNLGLDQPTTAAGFLIDALRAAHRRRRAGGDLLGGRRHLVHGGGDLFDLPALLGYRLVALPGTLLDAARLAFVFADGRPDPLDQLANLADGDVKRLAQLTQLVTAAHLEASRHVAI